ncbi:hypothetical protein UY3_05720 [Chelonia mydas]|uniref:Uncharacterized protein n=1 Tax=Chelonia mydas TaxID=8469 RepID=M7BJ18_CHEMY|nr:hypothetical protein UY3_05720 [Chelonia mydas]
MQREGMVSPGPWLKSKGSPPAGPVLTPPVTRTLRLKPVLCGSDLYKHQAHSDVQTDPLVEQQRCYALRLAEQAWLLQGEARRSPLRSTLSCADEKHNVCGMVSDQVCIFYGRTVSEAAGSSLFSLGYSTGTVKNMQKVPSGPTRTVPLRASAVS